MTVRTVHKALLKFQGREKQQMSNNEETYCRQGLPAAIKVEIKLRKDCNVDRAVCPM